jgi:A/G-specific adenine glycosylase
MYIAIQMSTAKGLKTFFTKRLLEWHNNENTRSLPWKGEKDAYKIWLSEIILQQTRVEQGKPYYLKFTETYPDVHKLAKANDDEVFRLWQGLGYYNRCKNMLATARKVSEVYKGKFPDNYDTLLTLPGLGPYTAAAVASFAFNKPNAVVDGNVIRVLSRFFGIETPFDTTSGKQHFKSLAQELLPTAESSTYNQAIMDLGATVCTPAKPLCTICPLQDKCFAYNQEQIPFLPVRSKKTVVKTRYFNYFLPICNNRVWVRKRIGKDIWQNLFEFYLIETEDEPKQKTLLKTVNEAFSDYAIQQMGNESQRLTHRIIETSFYKVGLQREEFKGSELGQWIDINHLKNFSFPRTIVSFLEKNLYF